jgi:myosin heavy subunit
MVHCEDISEPAILWNIKERFNVNKIYTRIDKDRKPNKR